MALDLVTGYKGQNHVTAEQWADFNRGIYGDAAILPIGNKMQVEIQTANQITVKDGTGVFDGRQVYIGYGESENIAIESGTQQMLRNDIVVIKYTKDESSGIENVAFEVVTGVPVASDPQDPAYQDMDIRTGVFTSQKPFCRVRLNGVAIEGVDMLVEVKEFADHAFSKTAANLTTSETGRALDATMGKQLKEDVDELNQNMNSIRKPTSISMRIIMGNLHNGNAESFIPLFNAYNLVDNISVISAGYYNDWNNVDVLEKTSCSTSEYEKDGIVVSCEDTSAVGHEFYITLNISYKQ